MGEIDEVTLSQCHYQEPSKNGNKTNIKIAEVKKLEEIQLNRSQKDFFIIKSRKHKTWPTSEDS